jgi:hypothetical protein
VALSRSSLRAASAASLRVRRGIGIAALEEKLALDKRRQRREALEEEGAFKENLGFEDVRHSGVACARVCLVGGWRGAAPPRTQRRTGLIPYVSTKSATALKRRNQPRRRDDGCAARRPRPRLRVRA